MPVLVATLSGLLALAFVLHPLYRSRREAVAVSITQTTPPGQSISEREQLARAALQEIELDYQLGNLAETDYHTLQERYLRRALAAIKMRDEPESIAGSEDGSSLAGRGMSPLSPQNMDTLSEQQLDEAIEAQLRILREHEQHATEK